MTKQLTAIDINTDTFQVWLTRFNSMITAANTEFVTANTDANGSVTVGNLYLSGISYSTTLTTSELRGGNVQSAANLNISSNVVINAASFLYIGNSTVNVFANSSVVQINGNDIIAVHAQVNVATSGTTAQLVDSFLKATYRGADYVLTVSDSVANNFQMTKALVFHDSGLDSYITEFGTIYSNTHLGSLSSNANTTHVKLYLTPTVASAQVKATRTGVVL